LFFLVLVIVPRLGNAGKKTYVIALKGLIDEYFVSHTEKDLEKKQLRFHRLTISTDRLMGQIFAYYGCRSSSVMQQLREAMQQKKLITYDQFLVLKKFHHLRNEVVHEGLIIHGDSENSVYGTLLVLKALLGG
jgi:hypothetical protein